MLWRTNGGAEIGGAFGCEKETGTSDGRKPKNNARKLCLAQAAILEAGVMQMSRS
jgi:hypothetical protein